MNRIPNFEREREIFNVVVQALTLNTIRGLGLRLGVSAATFDAWRGKPYARRARPGPERLWQLAQLLRAQAQTMLGVAEMAEEFAADQPTKGQFGGNLSAGFITSDSLLQNSETVTATEVTVTAPDTPVRVDPTGEPVS